MGRTTVNFLHLGSHYQVEFEPLPPAEECLVCKVCTVIVYTLYWYLEIHVVMYPSWKYFSGSILDLMRTLFNFIHSTWMQ